MYDNGIINIKILFKPACVQSAAFCYSQLASRTTRVFIYAKHKSSKKRKKES